MRILYKFLILIFILTLSSCGYQVLRDEGETFSFKRLGIGNFTLVNSKVHVYPFKSTVSEPMVEVIFTNKLIESLMRSSAILVEPESADYIITGTVKEYSLSTMSMSKTGDIGVYRLRMTVSIVVRDREGKVLFSRDFSDYEDYQVEPTIESTKLREKMAVDLLSDRIAQLVVVMLR